MVANLLHPLAFFLVLLSAVRLSVAATIQVNTSSPDWITYTNEQDEKVYLANFRKPALFTGDFGDCHGASLIDVSRFNAALYKDNKTVLVHWAGTTALNNQSIMSKCETTRQISSLTSHSVHGCLCIREDILGPVLQSVFCKYQKVSQSKCGFNRRWERGF